MSATNDWGGITMTVKEVQKLNKLFRDAEEGGWQYHANGDLWDMVCHVCDESFGYMKINTYRPKYKMVFTCDRCMK